MALSNSLLEKALVLGGVDLAGPMIEHGRRSSYLWRRQLLYIAPRRTPGGHPGPGMRLDLAIRLPETQETVDETTARFYETHAARAASDWEAAAGRQHLFAVAFPEGARVLDIGSGSGRDLARLLSRGYDAQGVEPTTALRALSVQLHPELAGRVHAGELPNGLPDLSGPFDGILCSAVWQHLRPSQFFDAVYSIKNLLKAHGRVLVTVSGARPGLDESSRDEFGRLCTTVHSDELALLFARTGFQEIGRWTEGDSRGRDFAWTTLLFELRSP